MQCTSKRLRARRGRLAGHTLTEVIVALGVFTMVMAGTFAMAHMVLHAWYSGDLRLRTVYENSRVMQQLVYGVNARGGLREASASTFSLAADTNGWAAVYADADTSTNRFTYDRALRTIVFSPGALTLSDHVSHAEISETNGGVRATVHLSRQEGRYQATNSMMTFVTFRNS